MCTIFPTSQATLLNNSKMFLMYGTGTYNFYSSSLTPVYFKAMDLYYDGNWSPKQVKLIVKVINYFGSKVSILLFYFYRMRPIKEFLLDAITNGRSRWGIGMGVQ